MLQKKVERDDILLLEEAMKQFPDAVIGDSDVCPLKHTFADGMYVREIFIPMGMLVVGKIHRHSHPNFLLEGEVSVATEAGVERLKAPCSMISEAGTKRVVYTHSDCRWVTVHANVTNTTDLKEIEKEVIVESYEEFDNHIKELP